MGWFVNTTPHRLYPRETDPVPIIQEAGWAPGSVWTGAETPPPAGFDPRTVQPVTSRYTDCAIPAPRVLYILNWMWHLCVSPDDGCFVSVETCWNNVYIDIYWCSKSFTFTKICTYILVLERAKISIKIHTKILLHVSVCDHHQGARTWA
jgi:hypothetical protein